MSTNEVSRNGKFLNIVAATATAASAATLQCFSYGGRLLSTSAWSRQFGQVPWDESQLRTHDAWKACRHGNIQKPLMSRCWLEGLAEADGLA
mmetsp:Transcript_36423/g.72022  ORF Transcript_36423/g.72022 Transcript_36423/m.72022 type:complete len:92 (-) Transcript_36423:962-1237(-)